jgi:hypothetical protein
VLNQPWIAITIRRMRRSQLVRRVLEKVGEPEVQIRSVSSKTICGGLEAQEVVLVEATYRDAKQRDRRLGFVVKTLTGHARREAAIYSGHLRPHWGVLCPRLLGVEQTDDGRTILFLEALRTPDWPWRDPAAVTRVLRSLAHLHLSATSRDGATGLPEWDYDAVLRDAAILALEQLDRCRRMLDLAPLRRFRPALRRMTGAAVSLRKQLLAGSGLPEVALHGDVHSGNVLLRSRPDGDAPVLIDWARARMGSPLEDVSSWLQSLGYWELEAARRHDTFLSFYLEARDLSPRRLRELRPAYWIAAASNVLAGALAHHLTACLVRPPGSPERVSSFCCARDCLRIIRRADAFQA